MKENIKKIISVPLAAAVLSWAVWYCCFLPIKNAETCHHSTQWESKSSPHDLFKISGNKHACDCQKTAGIIQFTKSEFEKDLLTQFRQFTNNVFAGVFRLETNPFNRFVLSFQSSPPETLQNITPVYLQTAILRL